MAPWYSLGREESEGTLSSGKKKQPIRDFYKWINDLQGKAYIIQTPCLHAGHTRHICERILLGQVKIHP